MSLRALFTLEASIFRDAANRYLDFGLRHLHSVDFRLLPEISATVISGYYRHKYDGKTQIELHINVKLCRSLELWNSSVPNIAINQCF